MKEEGGIKGALPISRVVAWVHQGAHILISPLFLSLVYTRLILPCVPSSKTEIWGDSDSAWRVARGRARLGLGPTSVAAFACTC